MSADPEDRAEEMRYERDRAAADPVTWLRVLVESQRRATALQRDSLFMLVLVFLLLCWVAGSLPPSRLELVALTRTDD